MFSQSTRGATRPTWGREMARVNPEMVILAREFSGHTQSSLAALLSFSQGTLSRYESGLATIPLHHAEEVARVTDRPLTFFYREAKVYGSTELHHRKRKSISLRELRQVHALVNEVRIQAYTLLAEAEIESDHRFYRLQVSRFGTPEGVARELRRLWQMPTGPVRSVVGAIESAGGVVFDCDFPSRSVDGVSQWPFDGEVTHPVLFCNADSPGDRQRFTLSHELGHLLMHHLPTDGDPEEEADRFASEFLMPADEIADDLSRLTIERAAAMKPYWKASIAAIVRRAYSLEKITERQYRHLNMQLSKYGYRTSEPVPLPRERPQLFEAIVDVHRQSHRHSDQEIADRLGIYVEEFRERFGRGPCGLRLLA